MKLNGSCACQAVKFELESKHPYPFNLCYCSICRKTAGSGGFGINLSGDAESLSVDGREHTTVYQATISDPKTGVESLSPAERHFCQRCATTLWLWDPRWPELIHPFASAIDTPLPRAPERTHLMLGSRPQWVEPNIVAGDKSFDEYPEESIEDWHVRLGLEC